MKIVPSAVKNQSSLDISKLREDRSLSREQLDAVQKTAELVQHLESMGYQRPGKESWVSEMLNNHQRGYLQSDIFTEAAVGLVWMAAKILEKAFVGNKDRGIEQRADVVAEIKGELAKIVKAAERQLAHNQVREATSVRNNIMSNVVTNAKELYNNGQTQRADKLIINTHNKIVSEAKRQYVHYTPTPEHQKILSAAMGRESERVKLAEKSMRNSVVDKRVNERDKDKGLGI